MDKKLRNIKEYLNKADTLLNYIQFKSLMENIKGTKNPIDIIQQYTQDIDAFTKFLNEDIYPNVRNRSIKHSCSLIIKSLTNPTNFSTPQNTPDNSDIEQ